MPRKPRKTREQKIVEEFFPVSPEDIKYSVEKKDYSLSPLLDEQKRKNKRKSKKTKKKRKKKSIKKKKNKEFKPPKIKLKKDGYELIVTEKPQAAAKISKALGKSVKKAKNGVPYYEVDRDGKKIIVACAVGHLFTLKQKTKGTSGEPMFDLMWVPNHFTRKRDFSKKYLDVLTKLAGKAGSITVATDYDVEGEVIGLNIIRFAIGQDDAKRMKFSSLTEKELNESYESKFENIDWGQAIAGETRHYLDWFYGINLSRALMNSLKSIGRFKLMSIGRVQGPTLNLIVKKEKQIRNFEPKPYWKISIKIKEPKIALEYPKNIFDKSKIKEFEKLVGKSGQAKTKKREKKIPPKPPFNLTSLQTESYRLFGISPSRTLRIAQSLYLNGLISYPRTSSQKLPPSVNYKETLKKLAKKYGAEKFIKNGKPMEGKKTDPAHPSIYPTGETEGVSALSKEERKIYDLISRRFICLFMESAIVENKKITVKVDNLKFRKKGSSLKKKAWIQFYPKKIKEESVPDVNGEVEVVDLMTEEKETKPPKRYTPASLVSELEKRDLGTKATRSSVLETLYDRNYIKDRSIKATPLGISLIETLERHSPVIIDEDLTRDFEKKMESIRNTEKNLEKEQGKVIEKAKKSIKKISKQFNEKQEDIGKEIAKANEKFREQQHKENQLIQCPKCKKGNLTIKYSKKTKRYFVACDSYPDCKNTYTLPPHGTMKPAKSGSKGEEEKVRCEECGFPKVMALREGKRPWVFCFNPDCETNKERIAAYRRKQKNKKS